MLKHKSSRQQRPQTFKTRGKDIFRIEAISDAVFAFSVSILAMSLEVPQTFKELRLIVNGALPFLCTVAVIFILWYQQYVFFRHYGLNDLPVIILNLCYLGLILFYVYPLKFLFSILIGSWTGMDLFPVAREKGLVVMTREEFPQLIMLFSVGYLLIWLLLLLMHKRAIKLSSTLALDAYEYCITKYEIRGAWFNAGIALLAIIFSWLHLELMAGICYLSIPLLLLLNRWVTRHDLLKA